MDLSTAELVEIAFDVVDQTTGAPPDRLGARVLAAARTSTPPVHPDWAEPEADAPSALDGFVTTAAAFADQLDTLGDDDWARPTRVDGATVRGLVAHLAGVERYLLGQLGRRPPLAAPRREDHPTLGPRAAAELLDAAPAAVAHAWWTDALAVVATCAELGPRHPVAYHHLGGDVRGLLVVRTFEVWTHDDDVRDAVGRPPVELDAARLSLMADELLRVVALGMALSGCPRPGRTARVTLTGVGGRTVDVALAPGEPPGPPDVSLTVETLDMCRLAANRLARADLAVRIEGDAALAEPLLVGATAFAAD